MQQVFKDASMVHPFASQPGRSDYLPIASFILDAPASAIGVDCHGDYRRDRDDAAALALLQVGGVEPQIRPLTSERSVEEGMHPLVDLLAQLGNLRLADP